MLFLHGYKKNDYPQSPPLPYLRCVKVGLYEISFVQLYRSGKFVLGIPLAHNAAQLVHHFPYRLVALVTQLTLHLQRGERLLGGGQQMDGCEPVHQRQFAGVHHSPRPQCGLMTRIRHMSNVSWHGSSTVSYSHTWHRPHPLSRESP